MSLKVLLAVHHFPPKRVGGAELIALRIARWLRAHAHDVRVLCVQELRANAPDALTWQDEIFEDVRVRRYNLSLPQETALLYFDNAQLRQNIDAVLEEFQPDVMHVISGYLMGIVTLQPALARRIPTVVTLTDFWFLCPTLQMLRGDNTLCWQPEPIECARCIADERRPFQWLDHNAPLLARMFWHTAAQQKWLGARFHLHERLAILRERQRVCLDTLNRVDALAPLTHWVVEMHMRHGLVQNIPVQQMDFFDVSELDAPIPTPRASDEIRFGYLGQVAPVKGVDVLLRAFAKLNAQYRGKKQFSLAVHGKLNASSRYAHQLEQLAQRTPNVVLHGAYENRTTLQLISDMDVVVVPSVWHENVPRTIFEAFTAHRPVIGSDVNGISSVVQNEENGLLFARGDADDLARVMQRVLDEPELLSNLAANTKPPRAFETDMFALLDLYQTIRTRRETNPA